MPESLAIDHVIFATTDLGKAAGHLWDEFGLASAPGGRHPDFGTENRIVPLGDAYLELMGIADAAVAARNPLGAHLTERLAAGDGWLGWCLRADVDERCARLGLTAMPGSRLKPDGTVVSWRAAGLEVLFDRPWLPFFIAWEEGTPHPGVEPAEHRAHGARLAWIEVGAPGDDLRDWLDGPPAWARAVRGEPYGVRAVGIATDAGETVLR